MLFNLIVDDPDPIGSSSRLDAEYSTESAEDRVGTNRARSRTRRAAVAVVLLAAVGIGVGVASTHSGFSGEWTAAWRARGETPRLAEGTRLKVGLVGIAPPDSDSREYTADGLQIALAGEIGRLLGADVELLPLLSGEADQALGSGAVDVLLTRGTPSLPEWASVIDTGYASGLGVLMRSDTGVRNWRQLEGKTLCVTKANAEAQALTHTLGAQARVFEAPAQALVAMRTGQCDGSVHDAALLAALRTRDDWKKFSATLEARAGAPLQLVTPPDKPALEAAFRRAVDALDRSSSWRERAEKWASNVAFEVFFDQIGPDCH